MPETPTPAWGRWSGSETCNQGRPEGVRGRYRSGRAPVGHGPAGGVESVVRPETTHRHAVAPHPRGSPGWGATACRVSYSRAIELARSFIASPRYEVDCWYSW